MSPRIITVGNVYEMSSQPNPLRVVGVDDHVVMYDSWWPHKNAWGMDKLVGTFIYYRMARSFFDSHSRLLRAEPLSPLELSVHRPDLPFAFARRNDLSWYEEWDDAGTFADNAIGDSVSALEAPQIFLVPFGPRDSAKAPVLVHAGDRRSFSVAELLRAARAVQVPFLGDVRLTAGVGIYRSGIKKRIPSFYLWGANAKHEVPAANAA